jgi:hypothetical protein
MTNPASSRKTPLSVKVLYCLLAYLMLAAIARPFQVESMSPGEFLFCGIEFFYAGLVLAGMLGRLDFAWWLFVLGSVAAILLAAASHLFVGMALSFSWTLVSLFLQKSWPFLLALACLFRTRARWYFRVISDDWEDPDE